MKISFLKLQTNLIVDNSIDAYQFRIYSYLLSLYNTEKKCAFPSLENISKTLNIGLTTVKKAIKHLKTIGYIEIEKQKAKIGNFNKYMPKHLVPNYKEDEAPAPAKASEEEIKEKKIIENRNIRYVRKVTDIDSNKAVREMITFLSYENVIEGTKNYMSKLERGIWKINTPINLFREIIHVYYAQGQKIHNKPFNFYKKACDNIAVQPKEAVQPKDSNGNTPIVGQTFIDDFIFDDLAG